MAARGPSPLFSRLIHRIYFNNSAVAHFFSQRARPAGILLVLLIPITWTLMPMYSLGPVYQLRGMIFAMLTISILWLLFRKAKVTTTRRLPRLATAGEPLQYHIIIHNTGKRTVSGANFLEMVPDNRPEPRTLHQLTRTRRRTSKYFRPHFLLLSMGMAAKESHPFFQQALIFYSSISTWRAYKNPSDNRAQKTRHHHPQRSSYFSA